MPSEVSMSGAEHDREPTFDELKRELAEAREQQAGTAAILKVISSSPMDLKRVFAGIATSAAHLCDVSDATIHQVVGDALRLVAHFGSIPIPESLPLTRGVIAGRAVLDRETIHVVDLQAETDEYPEGSDNARRLGLRTNLAVPLIGVGEAFGVVIIRRTEVRPYTDRQIDLLSTFADQAVIAVENTRLFEAEQARTRELAETVQQQTAIAEGLKVISRSAFDLQTVLATLLESAVRLCEAEAGWLFRGFYEKQGPKSLDALTRIRSNGKHLLGLINSVLDIAKIESGQFSLNLGEYALGGVVETVRSATEALAETKKLVLKTDVAESLPIGLGDEQRLTQVLLNLVGNAIKFTDAGEVRVTATAVNGHFNVTVADTGPGIPMEHQARIFEQFHQVDSSNTKVKGGTGLGLAIAKQIVEMHGGWVESILGRGSTFQLELPTRAEFQKRAP